MTTWATKDLPARLLAAQVAKLLNCAPEDVALLVTAGKPRPLGRPNTNAVKFFSVYVTMLIAAYAKHRCGKRGSSTPSQADLAIGLLLAIIALFFREFHTG